MKTIKATFVGTNGSLGYIAGKEYDLVLNQFLRSQSINIHRKGTGDGTCVYDNILTFFENWSNIKTKP